MLVSTDRLWDIQTVKMMIQNMIQSLMMMRWHTIGVGAKVQVRHYILFHCPFALSYDL